MPAIQPSGERLGTEDDRHLWPEMLRVIGEIQPSFVVGENVYGLINWSGGLVFEQVQTDLESKGYEIAPVILPASGAGAWHRRDRIWFVAHLNGNGWENEEFGNPEGCKRSARCQADSLPSNPDGIGRKRRNQRMQAAFEERFNEAHSSPGELRRSWQRDDLPSPTIMRVDDGIPNALDRVKSLGNSVSPLLVYKIFKALNL